jgi:hypothetical protein
MDVWAAWCKKTSTCHYCNEPILKHTKMIRAKMWRGNGNGVLTFSIPFYWHMECYIEEQSAYLDKTPYTHGMTGVRPPKVADYGDRMERNKILRKRAVYMSRLRAAVDKGNIDATLRIFTKMEALKVEIEPYGGVPESWITKVGQCTMQSSPSVSSPQQESTTGFKQLTAVQYFTASIARVSEHLQLGTSSTINTQQTSS